MHQDDIVTLRPEQTNAVHHLVFIRVAVAHHHDDSAPFEPLRNGAKHGMDLRAALALQGLEAREDREKMPLPLSRRNELANVLVKRYQPRRILLMAYQMTQCCQQVRTI